MKGNGRYLQPRVLQILGASILVGASLFWAVTGQQSALIVGAAISLIGLGAYSGLRIEISAESPEKNAVDVIGESVIERPPE